LTGARASWRALGTTAELLVTEPRMLVAARRAVEAELAEIDRACSRFRDDSDLTRLNTAGGAAVRVGKLLLEATEVALNAARASGGLVDPTVGQAIDAIGYDRDFDEIAADGPTPRGLPTPGFGCVRVERSHSTIQLPPGVRLDLGATAKALAADRGAARAAGLMAGLGVLVSLGGDIAMSGPAPDGGWPVGVADDHAAEEASATVALDGGGLATSSTTVRAWRRGGRAIHHIVDPATGLPAEVVWRTVSVAAVSCVDANTAATAAIVRGEDAPAWLEELGLPARLVAPGGEVVTVAGWPAEVAFA
jgi:thiamine biosynthesis lipoprotein